MQNSAIQTLGMLTACICLAIMLLWPDGSGDPKVLEMPTAEGTREYSISVPKTYDGMKAVPVVVVYHTPETGTVKLDPKTLAKDAIVVAPLLGDVEESDVVFGQALLEFIDAGYKVDTSQVFVCGAGSGESRALRHAETSAGKVRLLADAEPAMAKKAGLI